MAKKKQIILTHEELVKLAKTEHAPFWVYSSPMVAAVGEGAGGRLFPLEASFSEKTWLFIRIDFSEPASMKLFNLALEWNRRYIMFPYSTLMIIHPRFEFYTKAKTVEEILDKHNVRIPTVIDRDLAFQRLIGVSTASQVSIVQADKIIKTFPIEKPTLELIHQIEKELQMILRKNDPGLSLPFIFTPEDPHFFKSANASIDMSEVEKIKSIDLKLEGNWTIEANRILTQDSKASLSFTLPKSSGDVTVYVSAEPVDPKSIGSAFTIEVNEMSLSDSKLGRDSHFDEVQNAICSFKQAGTFEIAKQLNGLATQTFTLKTPLAGNKPIAIYGFRFFG